MDRKDIADGLKREPTLLEKVANWVRRHIHVATGRHGERSAEIGIKLEF